MEPSRRARLVAALTPDGVFAPEGLCRACAILTGTSGATVTVIADNGDSAPYCASDPLAARIEDLQHTLGEGPIVDAHRGGAPAVAPDLCTPGLARWPSLTPSACGEGMAALFAFPLRIGAARLGALTLYRGVPGPLTVDQFNDALTLAQIITDHLLRAQAEAKSGFLGAQLEVLATHRAEVHQATGMVSVQLRIGLADAFVRLRAHAYAAERPLADVAADVISRRLRLDGEPSS